MGRSSIVTHFAKEPLRLGELAAIHGASALDSARAAIEAALSGESRKRFVAAPQKRVTRSKTDGNRIDGYPGFVAAAPARGPRMRFSWCFDRKEERR